MSSILGPDLRPGWREPRDIVVLGDQRKLLRHLVGEEQTGVVAVLAGLWKGRCFVLLVTLARLKPVLFFSFSPLSPRIDPPNHHRRGGKQRSAGMELPVNTDG